MAIPRSIVIRVEHVALAIVPPCSRDRVRAVVHGPAHAQRYVGAQAPRPVVVHARQAPGRHVPAAAVACRRRVVDVGGGARLRAGHVHGRQYRGLCGVAAAVVAQRAGRHQAMGRGGAHVERVACRWGLTPRGLVA